MGDSVKILITADLFPVAKNFDLFSSGDTAALFGEKLCSLFDSADYRVANLEGCFTDNGEAVVKVGPSVRAPLSAVRGIKKLGIDCALLANTHAMDFGKTGIDEMRAVLQENGIEHIGAGDNEAEIKKEIIVEIKGRRFCFYNVTEALGNTPTKNYPGVNVYDEYRVCGELAELKKKCDALIVLYHGGAEMIHYNTPQIRRSFHRMAECGADIVISQHTHAIGEEEHYKNSYLLYGQGSFCFNLSKIPNEFTSTGLATEVTFTDSGFEVKNHLVRRTELGCVYDDAQDLSEFNERSRLLEKLYQGDESAEKVFDRAFSDYCSQEWFPRFFRVLRGKNPADDEAFEKLSGEQLRSYMLGCYTDKQLLALNMLLSNPEFNEIASRMIINAFEDKKN